MENQFRAFGTIRDNRLIKCSMASSKLVPKKERDFYDYCSYKNVVLVQWNHNRVVYMASNFAGIQVITAIKHFGQRQKKRIDVPQLHYFMRDNQGMGGVDLLDCFISQYWSTVYVKKWYYTLFLNCINMIHVAAWRLYVILQPDFQKEQLDFTRSAIIELP